MRRLIRAFFYSLEGLRDTFRTEPAFRLEIIMALILIPAAFFVTFSPIYRIILISSVLLVLMTELANTAIEATINRIGPEIHPLSKKAKDAGSAIVLIALINMAIIWSMALL